MMVKGYAYKEISAELGLSDSTVHTHIERIYTKLHVRSRSPAVAKHLGA
jgi:DNA-binding NarL/FixJ family response regulator